MDIFVHDNHISSSRLLHLIVLAIVILSSAQDEDVDNRVVIEVISQSASVITSRLQKHGSSLFDRSTRICFLVGIQMLMIICIG